MRLSIIHFWTLFFLFNLPGQGLCQSLADELISNGRTPSIQQQKTPKTVSNPTSKIRVVKLKKKWLRSEFKKLPLPNRKSIQSLLLSSGHYKSTIDGKFGPGTEAALVSASEVMGIDNLGKREKSARFLTSLAILSELSKTLEGYDGKILSSTYKLSKNIGVWSEKLIQYVEKNSSKFSNSSVFSLAQLQNFLAGGEDLVTAIIALESLLKVVDQEGKFTSDVIVFIDEQQSDQKVASVVSSEFIAAVTTELSDWIKQNAIDDRAVDATKILEKIERAIEQGSEDDLQKVMREISAVSQKLELNLKELKSQSYFQALSKLDNISSLSEQQLAAAKNRVFISEAKAEFIKWMQENTAKVQITDVVEIINQIDEVAEQNSDKEIKSLLFKINELSEKINLNLDKLSIPSHLRNFPNSHNDMVAKETAEESAPTELRSEFGKLSATDQIKIQQLLVNSGNQNLGSEGGSEKGMEIALVSAAQIMGAEGLENTKSAKEFLSSLLVLGQYASSLNMDADKLLISSDEVNEGIKINAERLLQYVQNNQVALPDNSVFALATLRSFLKDGLEPVKTLLALEKMLLIIDENGAYSEYITNLRNNEQIEKQIANSAASDFITAASVKITEWVKENVLDERAKDAVTVLKKIDTILVDGSDLELQKLVLEMTELAKTLEITLEDLRTQAYLNTISVFQPDTAGIKLDQENLAIEFVAEKKKIIEVLLLDLQTFLANGGAGFTFTLAEDVEKIQTILKKSWSGSELAKAQVFINKLLLNSDFNKFHQMETERRSKKNAQLMTERKNTLAESMNGLSQWTTANILHPKASNVAKFLKINWNFAKVDDLQKLTEIENQAAAYLADIGIEIESKDGTIAFNAAPPKFDPDTFYVLGNITGKARNSFLDLDGVLASINGKLDICVDQILIEPFTQIEITNRIFEVARDVVSMDWAKCGPFTDLKITNGSQLNENPQQVLNEVNDNSIILLVHRSEIAKARRRAQLKSEFIYNDLQTQSRDGYGALSFAVQNQSLCVIFEEAKDAHLEVLPQLDNFIYAHNGNEASNVAELSKRNAFITIQRGGCSALYANSRNLKEIISGLEVIKLDFSVLPFWISQYEIDRIDKKIETTKDNIKQGVLENLKTREMENELREQRLIDLSKLAKNKQARLRAKNDTRFTSLVFLLKQYLDVFAKHTVGQDYLENMTSFEVAFNTISRDDVLPTDLKKLRQLYFNYSGLREKSWRLVDTAVTKNDYGSIEYDGRKLQAMSFNFTVNLQNRIIGKYKTVCASISTIYDEDFNVWRDLILLNCNETEDFEDWKMKHEFASQWIVLPSKMGTQVD
jgi:hypothetical protein